MKTKTFLFFLLIALTSSIKAQTILGVWQFGSSEINAGYFDTYQFFPDSTFKFNTNQNDGLRRILIIGGKYQVKKNKLYFIVNYTIEVVGGKPKRSEIMSGSDSWSLEGGEIKTFQLKNPMRQSADLEFISKENTKELLIDKRKFFKVDNDPNNFQ